MSPDQIAEAIRIATEIGSLTADQRKILDGVPADSPLLAPWVNNPVPLAAVRSLFTVMAGLTVRPAVA